MPRLYQSQNLQNGRTGSFAVIVLTGALLLTGCSSVLPVAVHEKNRDITGQFDGTWTLQLDDITNECKFNFVNRTYMTVESGVGKVMGAKGYISRVGEYEMQNKVFYSSGKATLTFYGNLIEESGLVIVSYPESQTPDCAKSLTVTRA